MARRGRGIAVALVMMMSFVLAPEVARADKAQSLELSQARTLASEVTVTNGFWSCKLSVQYPLRWSGGNGGGEQGVGFLGCSHVMPYVEILVGLVRGNTIIATSGNYRESGPQVNAVASSSPYTPGTYRTIAIAYVLWPDNTETYVPQVDSINRTL